MLSLPADIGDRLARQSRRDGDCLVWTGTKAKKGGYGRIFIDGNSRGVHIVAWQMRYGSIPPETPCVLHRCDNPPCFADEHLWLGTKTDNSDDKVAKGRQFRGRRLDDCKRGHPLTGPGANLTPRGYCRTCQNITRRARYAARSAG